MSEADKTANQKRDEAIREALKPLPLGGGSKQTEIPDARNKEGTPGAVVPEP